MLEEMQWMATDFAQERKWKMATAKKVLENYFITQSSKCDITQFGSKAIEVSFTTDRSKGKMRH